MPTRNVNKPDAEQAPEKTVKTTTAKKATATRAPKTAGTKDTSKKVSKKAPKTAEKTKPEASGIIKIIDPDTVDIQTITQAMLDKKAQNVCSLDLREIGTSICDYFVICNADSTTNVLAIADNVEEQMLVQCKRKVVRKQGQENAFWIILDFANIVVHIFQTQYREFYRLEDLWADSVKTIYEE